MNQGCITALETRLRWLKTTKSSTVQTEWERHGYGRSDQDWKSTRGIHDPTVSSNIIYSYEQVLETGDTYYMDKHFCDLVNHARQSVPGDLAFDNQWMLSKAGFMWLEAPFEVPRINSQAKFEKETGNEAKIVIHAVGWLPVTYDNVVSTPGRRVVKINEGENVDGYWFCHFYQVPEGFNPWSYYVLCPGDKLDERIARYEQVAANSLLKGAEAYVQDESRSFNLLHEIRWVYCAMHLMAQKLATRVREKTDRPTRRRIEKLKLIAPPFVQVVTLRRLENDRQQDSKGCEVDWQWKWVVRGHWRNQWYPAENTHKPVFIESYVKGPEDRPLKPPSTKIFIAAR